MKEKLTFIGMLAIALSIGIVGISDPITAQTPPALGPDNFYVVSDTSICVKGAICTEDTFCNVGDVAVGGGHGYGLLEPGQKDPHLIKLDHLGTRLDSWALQVDNTNAPTNTEMTVFATCLNSTSTGG